MIEAPVRVRSRVVFSPAPFASVYAPPPCVLAEGTRSPMSDLRLTNGGPGPPMRCVVFNVDFFTSLSGTSSHGRRRRRSRGMKEELLPPDAPRTACPHTRPPCPPLGCRSPLHSPGIRSGGLQEGGRLLPSSPTACRGGGQRIKVCSSWSSPRRFATPRKGSGPGGESLTIAREEWTSSEESE